MSALVTPAGYLEAWGNARGWTADYPLLADDLGARVLLTHLVDAGERLTLGRCPACEGQGVQWQWGEGGAGPWTPRDSARYKAPYSVHYAARLCPACSEPGEPVECGSCSGKGSSYWDGEDYAPPGVYECHDCEGTGSQPGPGVPTGRRRVSSAEALLLARPGPWSSRSIEAVHGEPDKDTASLLQATMDKWTDAGHEVERLTNHVFRERKPGDPEPRAALHEYADRRQHHGDPLGRWLALWLSGAPCEVCETTCPSCGWHSKYGHKTGCDISANTGPCPACHGDGTALGQHLDAMVKPRTPDLEQLPACGGLPASAACRSAP